MKRRAVVRVEPNLVITRSLDMAAHLDPARRGGYLLRAPGKVPEIVLDGLASPEEQERAERRLRPLLQGAEAGHARHLVARTSPITPAPRPAGAGVVAPLVGRRLGERLLKEGLIGADALEAALGLQQRGPARSRRLGSLLVELKALHGTQLTQVLGRFRGVEASNTTASRVDVSLRKVFPLEVLQEVQAAPLCLVGKTLAVGMCDPHLMEHVDTLQALTSYRLRPLQAAQYQVHRLIDSVRSAR